MIAGLLALLLAGGGETRAEVVVEVTGFKDGSGQVLVQLWSNQDAFLEPDRAFRSAKAVIKDGTARVTLAPVTPGTYAVCAVHDANKNDRLDMKFPRRPAEGTGCSNGAKGSFGPPKWKDAVFKHDSKTSVPVKIGY